MLPDNFSLESVSNIVQYNKYPELSFRFKDQKLDINLPFVGIIVCKTWKEENCGQAV